MLKRHQVGLTVLLAGASACARNVDARPEAQLASTRVALIEPAVSIGDDIPEPSMYQHQVMFAEGRGQEFMLGLHSWYSDDTEYKLTEITRISAEGVQRNLKPADLFFHGPLRFDGVMVRAFSRYDGTDDGKSRLRADGLDDEFVNHNSQLKIVELPTADLGPYDADCAPSRTCLVAWHAPSGLFVARVSDKNALLEEPSLLAVGPAGKPDALRVLHASSTFHLFWTNPGSVSHLSIGEDGKVAQSVDTLYEAAGASIPALDVAHNDQRMLAVFTVTASGGSSVMARLLSNDGSVLGQEALVYDEITSPAQVAGVGSSFGLSYTVREGDSSTFTGRVSWLDQDGVVQGSEPFVPRSPSGSGLQNVVIAANDSRYFVAGDSIERRSAENAESYWRSYGSIFDAEGKVVVPVFDAARDRAAMYHADVAWDGEQYVVAWSSQGAASGVRVSAEGSPIDAHNRQFIAATEHGPSLEHIVSNGQTTLLVSGTLQELYATVIDRSGAAGTAQLITDSDYRYGSPGVASNGSDYLVAFKTPECSIRAVRVAADGTPVDAAPIKLASNVCEATVDDDVFVVWNGTSYLVTWSGKNQVVIGSGASPGYVQWGVFVSPDGKVSEPLTLSPEHLSYFDIATACSPDECVLLTPNDGDGCQLRRIDDQGHALDAARHTTCGDIVWDGKAFLLVSQYDLSATWIWPGGRASKSNLVETIRVDKTSPGTLTSDSAGHALVVYNADFQSPAEVHRISNDAEPGELLPLIAVAPPDAGTPTADAAVDGGNETTGDGGNSDDDSGTPKPDAGTDPGHAQTDAGDANDSGIGGHTDAGGSSEDAGVKHGKSRHGGGCSVGRSERAHDLLALQMLVAIALVTRRRRRAASQVPSPSGRGLD